MKSSFFLKQRLGNAIASQDNLAIGANLKEVVIRILIAKMVASVMRSNPLPLQPNNASAKVVSLENFVK